METDGRERGSISTWKATVRREREEGKRRNGKLSSQNRKEADERKRK